VTANLAAFGEEDLDPHDWRLHLPLRRLREIRPSTSRPTRRLRRAV
jgi:hypothetical protein